MQSFVQVEKAEQAATAAQDEAAALKQELEAASKAKQAADAEVKMVVDREVKKKVEEQVQAHKAQAAVSCLTANVNRVPLHDGADVCLRRTR